MKCGILNEKGNSFTKMYENSPKLLKMIFFFKKIHVLLKCRKPLECMAGYTRYQILNKKTTTKWCKFKNKRLSLLSEGYFLVVVLSFLENEAQL